MMKNYRSSPEIINTANSLIAKNKARKIVIPTHYDVVGSSNDAKLFIDNFLARKDAIRLLESYGYSNIIFYII